MSADYQAQFVQRLADDLNSKNISLPSFPDVVIKIRTALEDPSCSADQLAGLVQTDPVLVSRLLIAANSAFHNRAGVEIVDLNLAISRLGFEVVRNTAIALAVEQIFHGSQHKALHARLKALWDRSISMSSMCIALARSSGKVNPDNAFLAGLLRDVGELYVLTAAVDFDGLLDDEEALSGMMAVWCQRVGKSIVEAWGFSGEIADAIGSDPDGRSDPGGSATLDDVVISAEMLLADADGVLGAEPLHGALERLGVSGDTFQAIEESYQLHAQTMRQSVAG